MYPETRDPQATIYKDIDGAKHRLLAIVRELQSASLKLGATSRTHQSGANASEVWITSMAHKIRIVLNCLFALFDGMKGSTTLSQIYYLSMKLRNLEMGRLRSRNNLPWHC
jgi:hypothetical protein